MNLRVITKKFRQEVLVDAKGELNRKPVVVYRFARLCAKASVGLFLSIFLGPISLVCPIEIWLMKLGPDKVSHFIDGIEMHLRRSQLENNKRAIKIVIWPQKFPNETLATLYRRVVYIVGPKQKLLAKVLPFLIWRVKTFRHEVNKSDASVQSRLEFGGVSISFSENEEIQGRQLLGDLFGEDSTNFILVGYASENYRIQVDRINHSPQNLSATMPSPLRLAPAIEKLSRDGIKSIRQGLLLTDVPELSSAGLVAPNFERFKNGFPDVWLAANCRFLISMCTGNWWFGVPFNKPAVVVDSYVVSNLKCRKDSLLIFQMPWNLKENKYESFAWMLANPRWLFSSERLEIEYAVVENSSEQIIDVVDEQLARLNGTWVETDEDVELQERFQRLVWDEDADFACLPRVGAKFLREHQHLLPN